MNNPLGYVGSIALSWNICPKKDAGENNESCVNQKKHVQSDSDKMKEDEMSAEHR